MNNDIRYCPNCDNLLILAPSDIREDETYHYCSDCDSLYIIKNDELGRRLMNVLSQKARAGVKVRVLYDELGSRSLRKSFFKELRRAGGEVEAFFPSKLPLINLRLNYRNHRKLAIIDGKIGYVGGFNVGDEYLGLNKRFGYWRDTHVRIVGEAVHPICNRVFAVQR